MVIDGNQVQEHQSLAVGFVYVTEKVDLSLWKALI